MKRSITHAAAVISFGIACVVSWATERVVAADQGTTSNQVTEAVKTPTGPRWPAEFEFKQEHGPIEKGKPFVLILSITPRLFDVSDIKLKVVAEGDAFQITAGEREWAGALRKGETKSFKLTALASAHGFCGKHVLIIESKSLFTELRTFIINAKNGEYASISAKEMILTRIEERQTKSSKYVRVVTGSIEVSGQGGGK